MSAVQVTLYELNMQFRMVRRAVPVTTLSWTVFSPTLTWGSMTEGHWDRLMIQMRL